MKKHKNACTYNNKIKSAVTIGTFDGVHIGHKKIIERLNLAAKQNNLESIILTFFPHPRMILQKDTDIKLINTMDERSEILEQSGLNHLVIHPFSEEFSQLSAEEYVKQMLVKYLKAKKIIIGYDHRFGKGRTADINDLVNYGNEFGFDVEEISKQEIEDVAVSSTKIRKALLNGEIEKANTYLGYNFMLTGKIEKGRQIGRTLGYPTANMKIAETYKLIPKQGVYIVSSLVEGKTYYGMMNIGTNPTVNGTKQSIETHFFDTQINLYDKKIKIELLKRIRDEKKFDSMEELKKAMSEDEDYAREYICEML
ncbi:bifunctional riboflavin kinase/FAD synthetase [Aquimarina agarilytica]|uniref:bifunctional riboflavin kinase/FAD synthetase n=1 Tax=Aquimarina agarilytica TaxID=1087449 RepID=UPI000288D12F|nr:bifunctional riboflavin kinase/FAD synthetase [Aquimarina agarilytica]